MPSSEDVGLYEHYSIKLLGTEQSQYKP